MKFRIRSKLAAALALPLVALMLTAGLQAVQASEESDRIEQEAELAFVALGPGSVTSALQNERNFASLDLLGLAGATTLEVASHGEARDALDRAISSLESSLGGLDADVQPAFAPAFESLGDLAEVRAAYEGYQGAKDLDNAELAEQVFGAYSVMIDSFFDATSTVAAEVDEAVLRNGVELVDAASRRSETIAVATRNVVLDVLTGGTSAELRTSTIAMVERLEGLDARIDRLSVGPYTDVATETFERPGTQRALEIFRQYVRGGDVDITELLGSVATEEGTASIAQLATEALRGQAVELAGDAYDQVRLYTIAAAVIVALAIIITYVATTSITRPLRALRDEADAMAGRRLPEAVRSILDTPFGEDVVMPELEPIVGRTRDEVGEVVASLNKVQERTLALAADQAVLRRNIADSFVNLGRRNQNLLDRQLEFITELEQLETEPEQLDALFRLDHLATRMRRNAESLLVLAGTESPRQWGMPVDVDAVVRAGLGEVEDYRRVAVRNLDAAAVSGGAAAGVSHVVAELTENALQFSPPDEDVEIKGRRSPEGYVIAIADNGIGMPPEDLERANRRLAGDESYTVAPSRYLGHYVAGQLAARLGATVRLQANPAGGIIATVVVPPNLMEDPVDAEPTAADRWDPTPSPAVEVTPQPEAAPTPQEPREEWPAWEDEPATVPAAPESLAEALGGGRLDDVTTVADLERAFDGPSAEPIRPAEQRSAAPSVPDGEAPPTASSGLPKRVPGAQRPDASPLTARLRPKQAPTATPEPAPAERPSAHDVATAGLFGFLSEFNDGAARATGSGADPAPTPDHASEEER